MKLPKMIIVGGETIKQSHNIEKEKDIRLKERHQKLKKPKHAKRENPCRRRESPC